MTIDPFEHYLANVDAEARAVFQDPRFTDLLARAFATARAQPSAEARRTCMKTIAKAIVGARSALPGGMKDPLFVKEFEKRLLASGEP